MLAYLDSTMQLALTMLLLPDCGTYCGFDRGRRRQRCSQQPGSRSSRTRGSSAKREEINDQVLLLVNVLDLVPSVLCKRASIHKSKKCSNSNRKVLQTHATSRHAML